ncbi:hypothetical protein Y032_0196g1513 [Ancylostoma ceylanicum]|uniref:Uncharacterized protein n=1 Tax=Ancylostoma ceylanicum TaxID=53326 RepID=A0A016SNN0_9BILA|nr:hypothetical protein Y032_0196g1513 [Ancylostoma ceylanicum]
MTNRELPPACARPEVGKASGCIVHLLFLYGSDFSSSSIRVLRAAAGPSAERLELRAGERSERLEEPHAILVTTPSAERQRRRRRRRGLPKTNTESRADSSLSAPLDCGSVTK